MAAATRFLFEQDFGRPGPGVMAPSRAQVEREQGLAAARLHGYEAGLVEGERRARAALDARLAAALEGLAVRLDAWLGAMDAGREGMEAAALHFALAFATRMAGAALAARPLAELEAAAREALMELRGAPHVVVRLHGGLVEEADALLKRVARERGFEGRVILLGEPDRAPGDFSLEWADGGIARDSAALARAVEEAVRRHLGPAPLQR